MTRTLVSALGLAAVVFTATTVLRAQQPGDAPVKTVATTLEIMKTMTIPLSDAVFNAGAEPPKTDEAWTKVREQAVALAEAGNLLMLGDRVIDRGDWMKMARAKVDAADAVAKAATAKNADQFSMAADALYETCASCHNKYMKK